MNNRYINLMCSLINTNPSKLIGCEIVNEKTGYSYFISALDGAYMNNENELFLYGVSLITPPISKGYRWENGNALGTKKFNMWIDENTLVPFAQYIDECY